MEQRAENQVYLSFPESRQRKSIDICSKKIFQEGKNFFSFFIRRDVERKIFIPWAYFYALPLWILLPLLRLTNRESSESHQTCLNGRVVNEEDESHSSCKHSSGFTAPEVRYSGLLEASFVLLSLLHRFSKIITSLLEKMTRKTHKNFSFATMYMSVCYKDARKNNVQ